MRPVQGAEGWCQVSLHKITRIWSVAAMRCCECGVAWEQPMYAEIAGETWVCPHCLRAAKAERAGGRGGSS